MSEEQIQQETQPVDTSTQPVVENTVPSETETEQQINWRKFRESKEQERRARIEAEKARQEAEQREKQRAAEAEALKAAMESLLNKPVQNQYEEDDDEDVRIQRKIDEAIAKKQRQYEEERIAREKQEMPRMLKQSFPDFDKVCSEENVDYLEYHYPEVAVAYHHMPDSLEKWSSLYKAVKKLVPNTNSQSDRSKVEKNLYKPQSASISGVAQVGDTAPRILDEKQKMENYKRMQRAMKMV